MLKSVLPIVFAEIEPGNFHLFITVKIGRKNVRLLLDTGASKTAFDQKNVLKFVDEKNLKAHEMQSVGLGSNQVQTQLCEIPSLRLGEIILKKQGIAVLDLSHVNQAYSLMGYPPLDGVLGSDILHQLHAIIHYPKKELRLQKKGR